MIEYLYSKLQCNVFQFELMKLYSSYNTNGPCRNASFTENCMFSLLEPRLISISWKFKAQASSQGKNVISYNCFCQTGFLFKKLVSFFLNSSCNVVFKGFCLEDFLSKNVGHFIVNSIYIFFWIAVTSGRIKITTKHRNLRYHFRSASVSMKTAKIQSHL